MFLTRLFCVIKLLCRYHLPIEVKNKVSHRHTASALHLQALFATQPDKSSPPTKIDDSIEAGGSMVVKHNLPILEIFAEAKDDADKRSVQRGNTYVLDRLSINSQHDGVRIRFLSVNTPGNKILDTQTPPQICNAVFCQDDTFPDDDTISSASDNTSPNDETFSRLAEISTEKLIFLLFDLLHSSNKYHLTESVKNMIQMPIDPKMQDRKKALTPLKEFITSLVDKTIHITKQKIVNQDQSLQSSTRQPESDDDKLETASQHSLVLGRIFSRNNEAEALETMELHIDADDSETASHSGSWSESIFWRAPDVTGGETMEPSADSGVSHSDSRPESTLLGDHKIVDKEVDILSHRDQNDFESNMFEFTPSPAAGNDREDDEKLSQPGMTTVKSQSQANPDKQADIDRQAQTWLVAYAFTTLLHMNSEDMFVLLQLLGLVPAQLAFNSSDIFYFMITEINKYSYSHEYDDNDEFGNVKEVIMAYLAHFILTTESEAQSVDYKINSKNIVFIEELIKFVLYQNEKNQSIMQFTCQLLYNIAAQPTFWDTENVSQAEKMTFMASLLVTIKHVSHYFIKLCATDNTLTPLTFLEKVHSLSDENIKEWQELFANLQDHVVLQKRLSEEQQRLAEQQQKLTNEQQRVAEKQQRIAEEQLQLSEDQLSFVKEQQEIAKRQHDTIKEHIISICRVLYNNANSRQEKNRINAFSVKVTDSSSQKLKSEKAKSPKKISVFSRRKKNNEDDRAHPTLTMNL
jgi:hypothetical protein